MSHFKVAGRENWPVIDGVLEMVRIARAEGMRLTADQYPYIAGSTMLGAILPPWAHAGGVEATLARLASPDERGRLREAMLDRSRSEWDNFWKWSGPQGIIISDIPSGNGSQYVGKSLAEAAARAGKYFLEHGFFEHELSRKTDSYGAMTHIYTTYESRETKDGKPIDRGINSMEFFYDGERWWCVEIYWDAERPGNPIPEKYLGAEKK